MKKFTRQQRLVWGIADFLSDRQDDPRENLTFDESMRIIEHYGISFGNSCDRLVVNAIRHLKYVVNPWNIDTIPDILAEQAGFTKAECDKYMSLFYEGY